MAVLLLVVMPLMWASTSILVHLIAGIPLVVAMLIGAILTPTDPVLSTTVVHGKVAEENLPSRIREVVSAESGANDGLACPLVYLPLLLLTKPAERIAQEWLLNVLVFEVGGTILLGAIFGGPALRRRRLLGDGAGLQPRHATARRVFRGFWRRDAQ